MRSPLYHESSESLTALCWSRPFYSLPSTLLCNNVVSLPHHPVPFVYESQYQRQLAVCPGPLQPAGRIWMLCVVHVCVCACALPDCSGSGPQRPTGSSVRCLGRPPPRRFVLNRQPAQRKARKGTQRKARLKTESRQTGRMASPFHTHTHTSDHLVLRTVLLYSRCPRSVFQRPAFSLIINPYRHPFSLFFGFFPPFLPFPRLFFPPLSPSIPLPCPFPFTLFIGGSCVHTHTTDSHATNKNRMVGHSSPTFTPTLVASCSSLPSLPGFLPSVSPSFSFSFFFPLSEAGHGW